MLDDPAGLYFGAMLQLSRRAFIASGIGALAAIFAAAPVAHAHARARRSIVPDSFAPGVYDEKGVIYEVLRPDLIIDFSLTNGRATSLEMRDDSDKLEGRATRP